MFYCFGQGNTSLFAEKDLGETQKEQKEGDIGGGRGVPTGGADLRAEEGRLVVPAKTEGAGKVRPPYSWTRTKLRRHTHCSNMGHRRGQAYGELPIVPPATERH